MGTYVSLQLLSKLFFTVESFHNFHFPFLNTLLILEQFKFREFWQGVQMVPVHPSLNYFCY